MGYELTNLIHTDLVSLKNDALGLSRTDVAAAMQFGDANSQAGMSFAQSMKDAIGKVDGKEQLAIDKMSEVDSGRSDDLVGAMLASQEASLSFSMLMQVRNKVMGAVDDLIKLPL
ncbi:MAG TPA: flagellar hook-basal body complex protein FliE [Undibacterium sp.]|nr:flagellar hook-basal body complex protein FliE [Undibacterium sp.]HTD03750.1 flagellar hook-basal body complex protein FliE [Undibacterium sp.]